MVSSLKGKGMISSTFLALFVQEELFGRFESQSQSAFHISLFTRSGYFERSAFVIERVKDPEPSKFNTLLFLEEFLDFIQE